MAMIDTSKMSSGKAETYEQFETNRQIGPQPGFLDFLFMGKVNEKMLWPFPAQSNEDRKTGDELAAKVEEFLKKNVDADAIDREGKLPDKVIAGLKELGLFGMKIPKKYGGLGFSQTNYNRIITLVGSHCASTAVWLSAHQSIGVPQPLLLFGTEEQKTKWLPLVAKSAISGFALTEKGVGSDPAKIAMTATPVEDGKYFLLNGEKLWTTNGLVADVLVVMARTPDKEVRGKMKKQTTAFIVDTKTPGFSVAHRCSFMGIRAIENGVLSFKDVKVPRENIILGEGQGLKVALTTLNTGRLTMAGASAAVAKSGVAMARRWAGFRVQWGEPIGGHDAVAQKLASMAASGFAIEAMGSYVSGLADAHIVDIRLEAAMAKLFCSETAWQIADDVVQIMGGRGYETESSLIARGEAGYPVERMLRDFRINRIIEGSTEIMKLFIMREATEGHMKALGSLINPKTAKGAGELIKDGLRAGLFYAGWYPARWLPHGWFGFGKYGRLARHMRFVSGKANKLARELFHLMALNGPGIEKKQVLLGRVADIAADLFAMSCSCAYAVHKEGKEGVKGAVEMADQFCLMARRRVKQLMPGLWSNDDKSHYKFSKKVVAGEFAWFESGVMPVKDPK